MINKNNLKTHQIHVNVGPGKEVFVPVRRRDGTEATMGSLATDKALRIASFERKHKKQDHGTKGNVGLNYDYEDAKSKKDAIDAVSRKDLAQEATDILSAAGFDQDGQELAGPKVEKDIEPASFDQQDLEEWDDIDGQFYGDPGHEMVLDESEELPGSPAEVVLSQDQNVSEQEKQRRQAAKRKIKASGANLGDDIEDESPYYGEF